MNRVTFTVVGYVLFLIGFVSLVLALIGIRLQMLIFLDDLLGTLGSFLAKILMIVVGMIMFYMSRMPADEEEIVS